MLPLRQVLIFLRCQSVSSVKKTVRDTIRGPRFPAHETLRDSHLGLCNAKSQVCSIVNGAFSLVLSCLSLTEVMPANARVSAHVSSAWACRARPRTGIRRRDDCGGGSGFATKDSRLWGPLREEEEEEE